MIEKIVRFAQTLVRPKTGFWEFLGIKNVLFIGAELELAIGKSLALAALETAAFALAENGDFLLRVNDEHQPLASMGSLPSLSGT